MGSVSSSIFGADGSTLIVCSLAARRFFCVDEYGEESGVDKYSSKKMTMRSASEIHL